MLHADAHPSPTLDLPLPQEAPAVEPPDAGSLTGPSGTTFAELGLPAPLVDAVERLGYRRPTDIQAAAIPALMAGRDVTGVAQTGTGKTAAFGLPLLTAVDPAQQRVQALVLTPTRELAMQVAEAITAMAAASPGIQVVPIYGGSSYTPQIRALRAGAQVVVGTPGRVIDLAERGSLDLGGVSYLVLDEADEMLRMGFAEDVDTILAHTGPGQAKQVALFSATMPPAIRKVAREHMRDPLEVSTTRPASTTSTITQTFAIVPFRHKVGALSRVLATTDAEATLVFVRTRGDAEEVALALTARGLPAASISGDVPQRERERIVQRLRSGALSVLVATDVAARGLDVDRIGLVVNFDAPKQVESYVHRIGRTGRAGRSGRALTFFTPRERGRVAAIEKVTGSTLQEVPVPTPAQVSEHRARAVLAGLPERIGRGRLEMYRELLTAVGSDRDGDPLDLAAALLALQAGDDGPQRDTGGEPGTGRPRADRPRSDDSRPGRERTGHHPSDQRLAPAGDRRVPARTDDAVERGTPVRRVQRGDAARVYRVAAGHNHGARPQAIVGAITGEGNLRGSDVGKIEIFPHFSLVEIYPDLAPEAMRRLHRATVGGQQMRLRPDAGPPGRRGTSAPQAAGRQRPARNGRGRYDDGGDDRSRPGAPRRGPAKAGAKHGGRSRPVRGR